MTIVIAGKPNAGKSTLINALAGKDIAIVTPVAGTTRDVMRAHILLDDIPLHIVDTAGLRDSDDLIEQEGIKRAWRELEQADCVLLLHDMTDYTLDELLSSNIKTTLAKHIPVINVFNKIDLMTECYVHEDQAIYLSAQAGTGLDKLKEKLKEIAGYQVIEGQFMARRRHLDALDRANELLIMGQTQLQIHRAGELLAEDLRLAHEALCEITGEFSADDLLGKIFSSFCIGK